MKDYKYMLGGIIISAAMLGFGLLILNQMSEAMDLTVVIEKLQTNQTFVDELACDRIQLSLDLLKGQLIELEHTDELITEYEKVYAAKHCTNEVQK